MPDRRHRWRSGFGYGPETQELTLARFLPAELLRPERLGSIPDRVHDELLDQLVTTGLLGALAWLCLTAAVLWWGFRGLGVGGSGKPA